MAVILPFEVEIYRREGFEVNYVGHPLLDMVKTNYSKQESRKKIGIAENKTTNWNFTRQQAFGNNKIDAGIIAGG